MASGIVVSTPDRIITGLGLAIGPLAIAGLLVVLKKPAAASIVAGLGLAAGAVGAIGTEWFMARPGSSPLAKRGWMDGYPVGESSAALLADVNKGVTAAGGYAYSDSALSGIGGFWAPR
mgnify:CR=1 FL=1